MAVKGRETLESKQISFPTMLIILAVILGYTFLYNQVIEGMENYQLKTAIGIVALGIMVSAFFLTLRFITTTYEMVVTHNQLNIVRKIFFWRKEVANIPLGNKTKLYSIDKAPKVDGKTNNYTLANVQGKRKYALVYEEQGKNRSSKIQCSGNFYELIKKQCKI